MNKGMITVLMGAGLLAFSASGAVAAMACNGNVCWTVKERHTYPQGSGVVIREDTWKPGPEITIREARPGRGYWKGEVWTDF